MAGNGLEVGDSIPPFGVKDHEGYDVTDEDVIGTPLVIYFFPRDDIPEKNAQACAFQNHIERFDELKTLVIGVSTNAVDAHKKFIKENILEFSLLSDEKKDMCLLFGVIKSDQEERATFIADSQGVIRWIEKPVNLEGHVERVIKAVEAYCKEDVIKYDDFSKDYADFLGGGLEISENEKIMEAKIMKEFDIKKGDLK